MPSIRTNIRGAIQWGLTQITAGKGYNYTIKQAYSPPRGLSAFVEFPSVNITYLPETCANSSTGNHLQAGNESLLLNQFTVRFDCVLSNIDDPELAQDNVLADIQKYFGVNYWIPDSNGDATAFNCVYEGSEGWGIHEQRPLTGITVDYIVWYRQRINDPAISG